jgi:hypothetical protein
MPHDDNVAVVTQGSDDGVGVLFPASQAILDREVDGHRLVATGAEFGHDPMPVPTAATTAVDECERLSEDAGFGSHGGVAMMRSARSAAPTTIMAMPAALVVS